MRREGAPVAKDLLVLGFHNVEGTWCFPSSSGAGTRGLERLLMLLRRAANVVPLEQALLDLRDGRSLPPRAVALTFDDGYLDNVEVAAPLLGRLSLPATFFLVPSFLDGAVTPWWEELARAFASTSRKDLAWEGANFDLAVSTSARAAFLAVSERLKRRSCAAREAAVEELVRALDPQDPSTPADLFMDWDGARELLRRGFDIGSHTERHAILSQESAKAQSVDICSSRRRLQQELQVPVSLLAYPNGTAADYDDDSVRAAQTAGYLAAVTTEPGWNRAATPPHRLRRLVVEPHPPWRAISEVVAHARRERRRRAALPAQPDAAAR